MVLFKTVVHTEGLLVKSQINNVRTSLAYRVEHSVEMIINL